ncbi:hypothetical protein N7478_005698 [Penicillium angulare]|uniref:uncharacterized protein n=1 Tax=Penicillium angulare TaxID=116970 RepID=UPI00254217E2|nr:uncharacterized protein N7478_005698 [Penicillium angulare]KAJ5280326.1 hypothetical protein N7478_005698 [Penicillium angulare]
MAPQILHRVIHGSADPEPWQKALVRFQPAVLHNYRRHRVRGADYPGVVPASLSQPGGGGEITQAKPTVEKKSTSSVLGILVSGLTDGDIHRLDMFEGSEYIRENVKVRTLKEAEKSSDPNVQGGNLFGALDAAEAETIDEVGEANAVTYVWVAGTEWLESAEWDFETFKKEKMAWWVNADERDW